MTPSNQRALEGIAGDGKDNPTHDAMSAWLLRTAKVPSAALGLYAHGTGKSLNGNGHCRIELEALLVEEGKSKTYVAGIADALITFYDDAATRLWVEIKTDDNAIGALVRQIKMYKRLIKGCSKNWLVILPHASEGAQEFLAHAGIGVYCLPKVPAELFSITSRTPADPMGFNKIPVSGERDPFG